MNELFAWMIGLIGMVVPGFGVSDAPHYNGYVEADYLYAAPSTGGQIATIAVTEGQTIKAGDLLFTLTDSQQRALVDAADARVKAAEANLENLATGGREDEIAVVRATLSKAEADVSLARENAARSGKLFAEGLVPQARLDQDRANLASAEAMVRQLSAQLKVTELPARDAQQWQAEANLAAAKADAEKARADLADRRVVAPAGGKVERLFFDAGEMAAAGTPVLSLLPEGALKVKFYLPQAARQAFRMGDLVTVSCDGCRAGIGATLSFMASDPQFTPPVIYSRDERQRLSFLAEATLDKAVVLQPGQPVTLTRPE